MMSLKVIHIIGGGEFGGAERHILNLAGAINTRAVELTVCCLFEAPFAGIAANAGINAVAVPMSNKFDFKIIGKLAGTIRSGDFDLVHTHGVRANLMGRLAARRSGKRKVVTTVHSLLEMDYPGLLNRLAGTLSERATREGTDHFITVSRGLKDQLVRGGVTESKISVIYNGIPMDGFGVIQERGSARRKLGLAPGEPLVGIVARLHPVKGHRFFLAAAREVLAQRPDTRFIIVGDGPSRHALEALAARMGVTGRVLFTGFVEDVYSLMNDLDLLVISSLWEGFGLTAVEAMALGVPVVATEAGGLPEVVLHGETGLLAPPADSAALAKNILWMLEHPGEAAVMTKKGGENVHERFSAAVMARRTEELYRKVLGEAGGRFSCFHVKGESHA